MYDIFPYVEPCCFQNHFRDLFALADKRGFANFLTNSDLALDTLLEWLAWRVPGSELTLVLVNVSPATVSSLSKLMRRTCFSKEKRTLAPLFAAVNIISLGNQQDLLRSLPRVEGCEVSLCVDRVGFRAVFIRNAEKSYVIHGSINQEHGDATQLVSIFADRTAYDELWRPISSKLKLKRVYENK